jgi:hypothetical protein
MPRSLQSLIGGIALACGLAGGGVAQVPNLDTAIMPISASRTDSSRAVVHVVPDRDPAAMRAADSLSLTQPQRTAFFQAYREALRGTLEVNPTAGRAQFDSVLGLLVRETGRKMRFVRQARAVFSDMFARRSGDPDRAPGTEEELWRSPKNVASLIELYRKNPDATDYELERAMAPSFRP